MKPFENVMPFCASIVMFSTGCIAFDAGTDRTEWKEKKNPVSIHPPRVESVDVSVGDISLDKDKSNATIPVSLTGKICFSDESETVRYISNIRKKLSFGLFPACAEDFYRPPHGIEGRGTKVPADPKCAFYAPIIFPPAVVAAALAMPRSFLVTPFSRSYHNCSQIDCGKDEDIEGAFALLAIHCLPIGFHKFGYECEPAEEQSLGVATNTCLTTWIPTCDYEIELSIPEINYRKRKACQYPSYGKRSQFGHTITWPSIEFSVPVLSEKQIVTAEFVIRQIGGETKTSPEGHHLSRDCSVISNLTDALHAIVVSRRNHLADRRKWNNIPESMDEASICSLCLLLSHGKREWKYRRARKNNRYKNWYRANSNFFNNYIWQQKFPMFFDEGRDTSFFQCDSRTRIAVDDLAIQFDNLLFMETGNRTFRKVIELPGSSPKKASLDNRHSDQAIEHSVVTQVVVQVVEPPRNEAVHIAPYEIRTLQPYSAGRTIYEVVVKNPEKTQFEIKNLVQPEIELDIKTAFLSENPGADPTLVRTYAVAEFGSGRTIRITGTAFSIEPVADGWFYDADTRRGSISFRLSGRISAEQAKQWARQNVAAIVRDKNVSVSVDANPPPGATYISLGESFENGILALDFEALE